MASDLSISSRLPAAAPLPASRPFTAPAGTLVIEDHFAPEAGNSRPHGEVVNRATMQLGFQGPVQKLELPSYNEYLPPVGAPLTGEALDKMAVSVEDGVLASATTALKQLDGMQSGAVNLSQGASKAKCVETRYLEVRAAWDPKAAPEARQLAMQLLPDYARIFQLDADKLLSTDPEVANAQRAAFQQKLVDQISHAVDQSPQLQADRANFSQVTAGLDEARVSVVVAGENCGRLMDTMAADAGGKAPTVPKDFFDNALSNAHTVTVGASAGGGHSEHIANYSSPSDNVSVYADGEVSFGLLGLGGTAWGTSCSAPKVATVLAALHKDYPSLTNAEVGDRMQQQLTHVLSGPNGSLAVLDEGKARDFLHGA